MTEDKAMGSEEYSAPQEYAAHILAKQYAPLMQKLAAAEIEIAWRDELLAEKDAEISRLRSELDRALALAEEDDDEGSAA